MESDRLPDSGTANGSKKGRRMRKLWQKEEFVHNIRNFNFSKKKLKKEYSAGHEIRGNHQTLNVTVVKLAKFWQEHQIWRTRHNWRSYLELTKVS